MKHRATIFATLAILLSSASIAQGNPAAPQSPADLLRLGDSMHVDASQQERWQAVLNAAAESQQITRQQLQSFTDTAREELGRADTDLPGLIRRQNQVATRVLDARTRERQSFLDFYATASRAQQAAIRQFLLDKINRLERLQKLGSSFGIGN